MKRNETGFTLLETIIATCIALFIVSAALTVIHQIIQDTQRTNARMTAVFYGYWIGHDVRMAGSLNTEDLTPPELLRLTWTDWGYDEDSIYHTVTYSIVDISEKIGKLKRTHEDSSGTNQETIVAEYIYYDSDDPANTNQVTYQDSTLSLKVVTSFAQTEEIKEYTTYCRPNY